MAQAEVISKAIKRDQRNDCYKRIDANMKEFIQFAEN